MFVSLDGHDAHGWDGLGDAFGKTMEAAIFLEGDFHVGVVLNDSISLLNVGVLTGRVVHKIMVESFEEGRRTTSPEIAPGHVAGRDERCICRRRGGWAEERQDIPRVLNPVIAGE